MISTTCHMPCLGASEKGAPRFSALHLFAMEKVLSRHCFLYGFALALAWIVAGHQPSKGPAEDCSEAEGCPSFRRLSSDGWLHSFQAGRTGIPGTEIVQLVSHKGSLFASVGYWMHPSHHPGRILRLDCPTCEWEMEHPEEGNVYMSYVVRLECLKSVTWTSTLSNPVPTQSGTDELLHATGYLDWLGEAHCVFCTRNDATKLWACNPFYKSTPFTENGFTGRSMIHYKDPITGIEQIILPTGKDGVTRGHYDPNSPVRVSFDYHIESGTENLPQRPLAVAEMGGHVYMAVGPLLMKRSQGKTDATWTTVLDMLQHDTGVTQTDEAVGGLRGLTAIDNPASTIGKSLLVAWNPNGRSQGCIYRLDPKTDTDGFDVALEKCVKQVMRESYDPNGKFPYALAAYNDILAVPARNGGVVHLIGFMVLLWGPTAHSFPANPGQWNLDETTGKGGSYWAGGGYMIRRSISDYEAREIGGRRCSPDQADPVLTSVRAYVLSPFPEQTGVYFGGYDCNFFSSSNTAWIFWGSDCATHDDPEVAAPGCVQPSQQGSRCTAISATTTATAPDQTPAEGGNTTTMTTASTDQSTSPPTSTSQVGDTSHAEGGNMTATTGTPQGQDGQVSSISRRQSCLCVLSCVLLHWQCLFIGL